MDDFTNEIHHLQFLDGDGELPASITILFRRRKQPTERPITADDLLDLHLVLDHYNGRLNSILKS